MSISASDVERAVEAGTAALDLTAREVAAAAERFPSVAGAVQLILEVEGRLVVTGLGKSGLVGAKLAATFASTGTPAFLVHAADALHGDAGMLADDDLLLTISRSGATPEVVAFARLARGRGAQVIAMTGCSGESSLASLADALVDVGVGCESDPWDLVPTSSTSVTLAVGDALAVGVMVARGFGPEAFAIHHPAGALGERLRRPDQAGT